MTPTGLHGTTSAQKWRKRPVVIEAMRFDGSQDSAHCIAAWANRGMGEDPYFDYCMQGETVVDPLCHTLEGPLHVSEGDYVIRGVQGEFYPCKPDIFAATYEPATSPDMETT